MKVYECEWFDAGDWGWTRAFVIAANEVEARNLVNEKSKISNSPYTKEDSFLAVEVQQNVFQIEEEDFPCLHLIKEQQENVKS
jgi:hypothetical protein